jgi:L-ribulose-5-phosphate 3-epimerase
MKTKKILLTIALVFAMNGLSAKTNSDITIGVIQHDWSNIEKSFKELKDAGFGSCQLNYSEKMDIEFAHKVKAAIKKTGIKVTTLVGVPGNGVWNFREGPSTIGLVPVEGRDAKLQTYRNMIDFCVEAGIPAMHSHFGFIPEDMASPQYKDFIEVMKGLANYAKSRGIMIYFETGQETPITLCRTIKDIGTGNLFINIDVANLLLYGKGNPLDAVKIFGDLVHDVHAKDGFYPTRDNPYELGKEAKIPEGDVDFPAIIKQLKKQGYKGAITIECELNGDNRDYVLKTRKYFQNLIDK